MGRLGTFVPRLAALTVIWLLATAALTYAASQKISATNTPPATTTTAAPAKATMVVPDVRRQAYVFAKGSLGDAGFGWKIAGPVRGYASNTVVDQSPAPGTKVVDTGAPTIVLRLVREGKETGLPENTSPVAGTAIKLADLAVAPVAAPVVKPAAVKPAAVKVPPAKATPVTTAKKTHPAVVSAQRPPAFTVAGARKEPLDEMPLDKRAAALLLWLHGHPDATNANVKHWLFQHAWIVAGAKMGWYHGASALKTLVAADERVWALWGIGARSEAIAKQALAEVEARTS